MRSPARPRPPRARSGAEQDFLAFAERHRDTVRGCALLLVPDRDRADRLASVVLARRYQDRSIRTEGLGDALRELVHPRPGFFDPPWSEGARVRLLDAPPPAPIPLVAELARLTPEQRAAAVLTHFAGLPTDRVAAVLRTNSATVELWEGQARASLAAGRPERLRPGTLASELHSVVSTWLAPQDEVEGAHVDLAHGRRLSHRLRSRRTAALLAAVLVVVLAAVTALRPAEVPESTTPPLPNGPVVTPSPSERPAGVVAAQCDVRAPECQATVMRAWRHEMSEVVVEHLDPERRYFTGYSFSYDPRYDTPSFWAGKGGALGLELFRLKGGATEVYVQVATAYPAATRCGATTRQRCDSRRMMDGNRFTLSTSIDLSPGIEVQCWADVDRLVTVVARNTTRGKVLDVGQADLLQLIQDPRLRLPEI